MTWRSLDKIRTAMSARETFTDNLGRQTEIRTALRAVQATGVAGEELGCRRDNWCG